MKEMGKSNPIIARLGCVDIVDVWDRVIDDVIKSQAKVEKLEDGCLTIVVGDSVWLAELRMRKKELLAILNEQLKEELIKDIKFKAGVVRKKVNEGEAHPKTKKLPVEIKEEIEKTLTSIDDIELKGLLKNIFIKAYGKKQKE